MICYFFAFPLHESAREFVEPVGKIGNEAGSESFSSLLKTVRLKQAKEFCSVFRGCITGRQVKEMLASMDS